MPTLIQIPRTYLHALEIFAVISFLAAILLGLEAVSSKEDSHAKHLITDRLYTALALEQQINKDQQRFILKLLRNKPFSQTR